MTDEEKAEEYVNNAIKGYENDFTECEVFSMIICYKEGLAEGRKELEKENAELKEINKLYTIQKGTYVEIMNNRGIEVDELRKKNAELKAEIKQIIERERVVPEHYLCEMIEKIHCCQMCKHLQNSGSCLKADNEEVKKWDNFLIETRRKNFCKNWELVGK